MTGRPPLLRRIFGHSVRQRLVVGVALVHAVLMVLFVADVTYRQRAVLAAQSTDHALGLARMIAVNSVSWVLADDVSGLAEVIDSIRGYPDILYAMVVDPRGRVIAHTEHTRLGLFVVDEVSRTLLAGPDRARTVIATAQMVETAAPVVVAGRTIGWARVAVDHRPQGAAMRAVIAEGLAYIALAIVLGTLFALWIAGRLTAELSHLSDETNHLRDGERSFDRVTEPCREVARLEQAFLDMAETIWKREDQLRHTIDQLATSNEDLERFAYVASHDLQTPLRNIGSYAQLLERRYRGRIDADADDFINFIVDGTRHMSAMIHDLLDYARLSSRGKPLEPVPANRALKTVLANLSGLIAETGAVVTAQDLPVVMADESQLVSLLQNLIENAVKYRHPERRPEIAVTAEALPSHQWRFAVADNGIGIEPEYFDRIFVIFQRLRPETNAEGTGIGLAVCQRIAHRFGGRIWVESAPGRGTTFFFTLIDGRAPPAISAPSPATGL